MKGKFKKLFRIILSNKKTLVLGLGIVIVLSLVPLHFTQANVFSDILGGIVSLPVKSAALFIAVPLALIALGTGVLYTILIAILGWLKTIILSVPVIPSEVGVVQEGWEITRNLANMGFILILVFIGLATILRIKEYEAKKLLPILIIVALLINFSPVIVGFVVDVSNIITNFFLDKVSIQSIGEIWSIVGSYLLKTLGIMTQIGGVVDIIGSIIGTLVLGVVIICFFGYASWIYLIVMALLIVRIIALWILMILAPLAFLFYVLPAGRKLAREWWHNLFHWSIIAIPIGFFLFLSFKVLSYSSQVKSFFKAADLSGEVRGITFEWGFDFGDFVGTFTDALGAMLVPLVSIVILHIGYKFSRRYMPAAANQIIGGIEKGAKMVAGAALVAATGGAAAGLAVKGLGGMAKGAQMLEGAMGRLPVAGKALKWGIGKPISWTTRGVEMAAKPWLQKQEAKLRKINPDEEMKKRGIEDNIQGQLDYVNKPDLTDRHRLQVYSWMANKGTLQKTSDKEKGKAAALAERFAGDPHFKKEAGDVANVIPDMISAKAKVELELTLELQGDMKREIEEKAKDLSTEIEMKPVIDEEAERLVKEGIFKTKEEAQELASKNVAARYIHFTELKSGNMKDVATPSIKSKIAARALRDTTPGHLQAVVNNFKPKTSNAVLDETFNGMFRDPETKEDYSDEKNREILKNYYQSDPRHARMIHWSSATPAGREMNLRWKKYMPKNKKGRPDFAAFETEMEEKEGERRAEAVPPKEEIIRLQEQMAKLKTEIAKPYSALSSDKRTELRKRQAEAFKRLNIELTELQERQRGERLTPEELATEAAKGALEEIRKEKEEGPQLNPQAQKQQN